MQWRDVGRSSLCVHEYHEADLLFRRTSFRRLGMRRAAKRSYPSQYLFVLLCILLSVFTLRCFWPHRSWRQAPDLWVHGNELLKWNGQADMEATR